jgi:hypothetical protein
MLAFAAKHKLALVLAAAAGAAYWWHRRTSPVKCSTPGAFLRDGKCYRSGFIEPLFDELDASDAPVAFDDFGNPLITKPSQL